MTRLILRTDEGPDFEVNPTDKLSHVEAYSGKTGKHTGHVTIYRCGQNLLLYCVDKTKPEGKNRAGWVLNREVAKMAGQTLSEKVLQLAGERPAVKAALRAAGFDGPTVTVDPSRVTVE